MPRKQGIWSLTSDTQNTKISAKNVTRSNSATGLANNRSGISAQLIPIRPTSRNETHDEQEITDDTQGQKHSQQRQSAPSLAPVPSGKT
jgi:hypothetical protein